MIADVIRRLAMSDLPTDLALVQVDCSDATIGRFQERQAFHCQTGPRAFTAAQGRPSRWTCGSSDRSRAHRTSGPRRNTVSALDVIHV